MAEGLQLINCIELQSREEQNRSLFFEDGKRRIDYVLAYVKENDNEKEEENSTKRELFLKNLEGQRLQLEHASVKVCLLRP